MALTRHLHILRGTAARRRPSDRVGVLTDVQTRDGAAWESHTSHPPAVPRVSIPGDSTLPAQRAGQQASHPRPGALSPSLLGSQRKVRLQPPLGAPAHMYNPSRKAVLVFTADQDTSVRPLCPHRPRPQAGLLSKVALKLHLRDQGHLSVAC